MSYPVSATFRLNCYDDTKKQRMVFVSTDYDTILTNEDIIVGSKVKFNLASCKSQQIMFGEVNTNTCTLSLANEDGHITSGQVMKEFRCYVGVEVSSDDYKSIKGAITAARTDEINISLHSTAPYIRGNCTIGTYISELENGWDAKMLLMYDRLYFVVEHSGNRYYDKHSRTGVFSFGNSETVSTYETYLLDRLMDDPKKTALSFYTKGFEEYLYDEEVEGDDTWSDMKSGTWSDAKDETWGHYSGYTNFKAIRYEAVPYGVWHFDKPRRVNTAVLTLNGKDRGDAFDEDSREFVVSAGTRRYTVIEYMSAIASYKSVPVGDTTGFNALCGEITIVPNYMEGKALKDMLSYGYEVGAVNAMIDRNGCLTCNNSDTTALELPYVYSFDVADYAAHTINKALVYKQGDYMVYQTDGTILNGETYEWDDNPMFANSNPTASWFSNNAHVKYGGFNNAITVTDADYSIWCDDVYSFTQDGVTYVEPIFAMSVEWDGFGRVTYTNYGEESRTYSSYDQRMNAVTSVNDISLQGFNEAQRADKLYFDSEGLTVESKGLRIKNADGEIVFDANDDGDLRLKGQIEATSGDIGKWKITDKGLRFEGIDEDGSGGIVSLEPYHGVMGLQAINKGYSKIDVNGSHIMFDECDSSGTAVLTTSCEIKFNTYDNENQLQIGMRKYSGSTKAYKIRILADTIYMSSSKLEINGLPSTVSAANMAVYSDRIYYSTSLRKYKDDIKTIENASEKVDNLRGVSFKSKCEADDPNRRFYGFIAEEVEKVAPELVTYENDELQGVQYERVCALLVEDNKALHKRIADLESRLAELERRLDK